MRPRISIWGSVRWSVGPSVGRLRIFFKLEKWRFFFMYVIREAQKHHSNVELHLYRKVTLLVHLSVFELSWKKKSVERTHLLVDQTCFSLHRLSLLFISFSLCLFSLYFSFSLCLFSPYFSLSLSASFLFIFLLLSLPLFPLFLSFSLCLFSLYLSLSLFVSLPFISLFLSLSLH